MKSPEDLLREIEDMIRVEPGDLQTLPDAVRRYIEHGQALLCVTAAERDRARRALGLDAHDVSPDAVPA